MLGASPEPREVVHEVEADAEDQTRLSIGVDFDGLPLLQVNDRQVEGRKRRVEGVAFLDKTVEEALRRVAAGPETERARPAAKQRRYLEQLSLRVDVAVLASEEMWR